MEKKCKKQTSKFRFLNAVTKTKQKKKITSQQNQHRKGSRMRMYLAGSWSNFRYANSVLWRLSKCSELWAIHISTAKQVNCWMWLLTLLVVNRPTNTGQIYILNHRAFAIGSYCAMWPLECFLASVRAFEGPICDWAIFSAVFFWVLDDYMSKFNLWKSYAHHEPFGLGKGYLANLLHAVIFFK